jgi:hypothetical protein
VKELPASERQSWKIMKISVFLLSALLLCGLASGQEYKSTGFTVRLFDKRLQDSGLIAISVKDKLLFSRNYIYIKYENSAGESLSARERASPEYTWQNNVLSSRKDIADKDGNVLAEVFKSMTFTRQSIAVDIKAVALRSFTMPNKWNYYREILQMPVSTAAGFTVEGSRDGRREMALIPKVYDRKKWGFKKTFSSVEFIGADSVTGITVSDNSRVRVNHYGGSQIEVDIAARTPQLRQVEAGTVAEWGYTITFADFQP